MRSGVRGLREKRVSKSLVEVGKVLEQTQENLIAAIAVLREARSEGNAMALVGVVNRLQAVVLDVGVSVREVNGIQREEQE